MMFFKNRVEARSFSSKSDAYKVVDNGPKSEAGKRWGVRFV